MSWQIRSALVILSARDIPAEPTQIIMPACVTPARDQIRLAYVALPPRSKFLLPPTPHGSSLVICLRILRLDVCCRRLDENSALAYCQRSWPDAGQLVY